MRINKPAVRITYDLVLFTLALTTPWWISLLLAMIGLIVFEDFIEIIPVGLSVDAVQFNGHLGSLPYFFMIISTIFYFVIVRIKKVFVKSYFP